MYLVSVGGMAARELVRSLSSGSLSEESSALSRGALASALEDSKHIRERLRDRAEGTFTRWPSNECIGVPSVKAMSLNHVMLEIVALTWCPLHSAPKMLPIELCRREAR